VYDAVLPPRRPPRILIVEPNPGASQIIVEILSTVGCDIVGPCATLAEATAKLAAGHPVDGAVLEMNVGGSYSFALAEMLLGQGKAVLFFSRSGAHLVPKTLRRAAVLSKPEGIEVLADTATDLFFRS
jgi:DNA-binding NarL/FixJ family response regulator